MSVNEHVKPNALQRVHIDMDLAQSSIEDIACNMGVDTSDLIIFCSRNTSVYSMRIARELGCTVVLVPDEIVKRDHWAVHHKQRHEFGMWSTGA
jgi:hypothetical protein